MTSAAQRLKLYSSLPPAHREAAHELIQQACYRHVWRSRASDAETASATAELFSEVMAKLLRLDGEKRNSAPTVVEGDLPNWEFDAVDPDNDGRVKWLVQILTSRKALNDREEDIRRRNWGRRKDGYRLCQIGGADSEGEDIEEAQADYLRKYAEPSYRPQIEEPEIPDGVHKPPKDTPDLVWAGLLSMAQAEFDAGDDVLIVLGLLAQQPAVREAFGVRPGAGVDTPKWPVGLICDTLNDSRPNQKWTVRRLENTQAKLERWLARIRRQRGLKNNSDVRYLFAQVALELQRAQAASTEQAAKSSVARTSSENTDHV